MDAFFKSEHLMKEEEQEGTGEDKGSNDMSAALRRIYSPSTSDIPSDIPSDIHLTRICGSHDAHLTHNK